jgi:hypothetical protein
MTHASSAELHDLVASSAELHDLVALHDQVEHF